MGAMNYRRLQAWVLRLVGVVEALAFGAVVMPRDWMESYYGRLGVGEMPRGPVFDSVVRQVSLTYGLHGVALWLIAADVVRYRPLMILTAIGYLLAGPAFILIDLTAGMPGFWTAGNGGPCLLVGSLVGWLVWADAAGRPSEGATIAQASHPTGGQ
jgi:hypothetical protein